MLGKLESWKDLLEKLRHDLKCLEEEVDSYKFFNFVVTAYHLRNWIRESKEVPDAARAKMDKIFEGDDDEYKEYIEALRIYHDVANTCKHFRIKNKKSSAEEVQSKQGYGRGRFGKGAYGTGEEEIWIVLSGPEGQEKNVLEFSKDIVHFWETFIKNEIPETGASMDVEEKGRANNGS